MTSTERRLQIVAILEEAQKYWSEPPVDEEAKRWLTAGEQRGRLADRIEALFETEGADNDEH